MGPASEKVFFGHHKYKIVAHVQSVDQGNKSEIGTILPRKTPKLSVYGSVCMYKLACARWRIDEEDVVVGLHSFCVCEKEHFN
jgi:hypothetical protein